jgi:inorganic triphosphatase YgiF
MPGSKKGAGPVEIELKLAYDPADGERLVLALASMATAGGADQLVSTYFDTPERDLARAGYSLRVRRRGREHIQTVKAVAGVSAGLFERPEWEHPLRDDRPQVDAGSGPLIEAVGAEALGRIVPQFVSDVRRTAFRFECAGATIEVAMDQGEVRADARAAALCEVELELRRGAPQAMFDLARALNEKLPLRLGVRSKAERGDALLESISPASWKAEPIALDQGGDAGEAFRIVAQSCIRQFRLNEELLLESGDAEALHQARVGLRRLRSAFSIFAPLLVGDPKVELLNAELRWLAAELGGVRNIDVLIARVDAAARDRLAAARDREFGHVRAELAGARTRLLMIDLAEWLVLGAWRTAPTHPGRLERNIVPFARDLLDTRCERLRRRGEGLAGLDRAHRHRVRIQAKKLRYAAEFFASLYASGKAHRRHRKFVAALGSLQDLLGELNDLAVGPELLARLGIVAKLSGCGERRRKRLLDRAEQRHDALMRARPFW